MFCDVKFREPNEKAVAKELDVDDEVDGRSVTVGEEGTTTELTLCEGPWRGRRCS
jgi:hypothetical protein